MKSKKLAILALALGLIGSFGLAACGGNGGAGISSGTSVPTGSEEVQGETLANETAWAQAINGALAKTNATATYTVTMETRRGEYFMIDSGKGTAKVADGKVYHAATGRESCYYPTGGDGPIEEKDEEFVSERYISIVDGVATEWSRYNSEEWECEPYNTEDNEFTATVDGLLNSIDISLDYFAETYLAFQNVDGTYIFELTDGGMDYRAELKFLNGLLYSCVLDTTYTYTEEGETTTESMYISLAFAYDKASVGALPGTEQPDGGNGESESDVPTQSDSGNEDSGAQEGDGNEEIVDRPASEGLEFTLNQAGTAYSVTGIGACTDTEIVIPEVYNTLPVTKVGDGAFSWSENITMVVIPSSVTEIGLSAFANCSLLETVVIFDGVTKIGRSAFKESSNLKEVDLPDSITSIGSEAFYNCDGLTEIVLPEGVTSIEWNTFAACTNLEKVVLPEGVTNIGDSAFESCGKLNELVLPDSVRSIGGCAFYECSSLTEIAIPNGVGEIMERAFYGCGNLSEIVIPDSVTSIGWRAFMSCEKLAKVTIGSGVTKIDEEAFYGCEKLAEVNFNGTLAQWEAIEKLTHWNRDIAATKAVCSDGEAELVVD